MVRCWVWLPAVGFWWRVSVSVSLSGGMACFPVVGVICCGALLPCVVFCGAVVSFGAVLACCAVFFAVFFVLAILLYVTYDDERHGVTFLYALRRLRRHLLTYISYKIFRSCFNAFRRALFCLSVSMVFDFIFSYL